jgi:ribonuclease P protein component
MSRGVRREGLSRRHRFHGRDCFRPILRGSRKLTGNLAVLHVARGATPQSRFGISVGKRAAKSAVDRNRVKRRARELFRRHESKRAQVDVVVTLSSRFGLAQVDQFLQELAQLMDRLRTTT